MTFYLALGGLVILAAWRAGSLSASGAVAAALIGTAAAAAGGQWVALLLAYFVSSSVLSRLGRRRKLERTAGMIAKPGARDAGQVLSNGIVFGLAAATARILEPPPELWLIFGTGALAASAADTWATEIGTLVGGAPRSILTGRTLPVGASGGVTAAGLLASVAGAALVTYIAGLNSRYFIWIVAAGVLGALADSVAGAILQKRLWCDACGKMTEMDIHSCGTATRRIGGLAFMENDAVNLLATIVGAAAAFLLVGAFA
jgi:uncharacterized protein (TIGR00297 family)